MQRSIALFLTVCVLYGLVGCSDQFAEKRQSRIANNSLLDICRKGNNEYTRWASFENPTAEKGKGGMTNKGAKGNACVSFEPGETKVLLDVQGCGVVNRMWMTTQRLPFSTLIPRKTGYHQSPVLKNEQLGLMGM